MNDLWCAVCMCLWLQNFGEVIHPLTILLDFLHASRTKKQHNINIWRFLRAGLTHSQIVKLPVNEDFFILANIFLKSKLGLENVAIFFSFTAK